MTSRRWIFVAVMSCMVLLSTVNLFGQVTATANLQGTIMDKSQAVIGNKAEVTLTNKETGTVRTVKTNDAGEYKFEALSAGIYSIKVSAAGFSTAEAKDVELLVGRTATQNFTLQPGTVSETIEVTAAAPLVDEAKTDVSTNITPEQITELPLIGRDIADLAYLAPGVKVPVIVTDKRPASVAAAETCTLSAAVGTTLHNVVAPLCKLRSPLPAMDSVPLGSSVPSILVSLLALTVPFPVNVPEA